MKKLLFILIVLAFSCSVFGQQEKNLPFLSRWDDDNLPNAWTGAYNDCWGYTDKGREYAILGSIEGTFFFDITDPYSPKKISFQKGRDTIGIHRDFKTYKNFVYGVCDEGTSSLQIFDLSFLPDSVVKVYDSNALTVTTHNIFINNDKIYFASNTTLAGYVSMSVASLADPENPTFISNLNSPQFSVVHDVYVRNDTAFVSCGVNGLFIYDYTDPYNPQLLQTITSYPEQGYNHSSWITDDGKTLVFADETHGSGLKVFDISNLDDITFKSTFQSNLLQIDNPKSSLGSIPHNPFIVGDKVFVSYYHDGAQVYDISDKENPKQLGYYDTYPQNINYSGYAGAWGIYPFLPSQNIIVSDISNGLFILDGSKILSPKETSLTYPNPATNNIFIPITSPSNQTINLQLFNIKGQSILSTNKYVDSGKQEIELNIESVTNGFYLLKINGNDISFVNKIIIAKN